MRSQQPRSLPPICLTTPYQCRTHRLRAWPSSQHSICISGSRSSSGGREKEGASRETEEAYRTPPGPLAAAVHRCSSPLRSIALALQRQKQRRFVGCRGLQHAACSEPSISSLSLLVFFPRREYVCAYVAVKKNSFPFSPRQKKQALGVCAGLVVPLPWAIFI